MSTASIGIRASKPASFIPPSDWPDDYINGIREGRWEIAATNNVTAQLVPPAGGHGLYSGGYTAAQITPGGATTLGIRSVGTWYQNLPAQNLYVITYGIYNKTTPPPFIDGSLQLSMTKGTALPNNLSPPKYNNVYWHMSTNNTFYNFYGYSILTDVNVHRLTITISGSPFVTHMGIVAIGISG